jgi:predicted CoA-binding protein
MTTAAAIKSFFASSPIAVIGVSRKNKHFSNIIYKRMKEKGYKVLPVNPNAEKVLGDNCYACLSNIPGKVESALILTASKNSDAIVKESVEYGIKNLWIQQQSETKTAIETAVKNNINVIHHQCIMMFTEPVKGIHSFHKGIKKLFGKLPK